MWDSNLKTLAHKFQSARSNHHHVFPANENMKRKWVAAVQRKDFMPTKHSRICSKHFTEDCYDTEAFGIGRRLKPNVVPSLFEYSSCLRKKSGKRKASIKRVTSAKLAPTISDVCVSNLLAKVKYLHKKFIVVDKENMNLDAQAKDCSELFNCYESDNRDVLRDTCISEAAPQNLLHVSAPTSSKYQENKQTALIEEHHRNEPYENEKVSLEYMCRVCAEYSNRLIPLFEKGAEDVDVVTKIHTHLPIMVTEDDVLPTSICEDCLGKLDVCHSLVNACLNADEFLRNMFDHLTSEQVDTVISSGSNEQLVLHDSKLVESPSMCVVNSALPDVELNISDASLPRFSASSNWPQYLSCVTQDGQMQVLELIDDTLKESEMHLSDVGVQKNLKTFHYCKKCSLEFGSMKEYLQHRVDKQCCFKFRYCNRNFKNKRKTMDHELSHSGKKRYVCRMCGKGYGDPSSFHQHVNIHRGKKYVCKECGKEYNNRSGLYWHSWTHRDSTHLCEVCGQLMPKGSGVYTHKLKHSGFKHSARSHGRVSALTHLQPSHTDHCVCKVCEQSLRTGAALDICAKPHKSKSERQEGYSLCSSGQCGTGSSDDNASAMAPIACLMVASFKCGSCGKTFTSHQQLDKHVDCTKLVNLKCPTCGKIFKSRYNLLMHKQAHINEMEYNCNICGKTFSLMQLYKKHCVSHSLQQPFQCTMCSKTFKNKCTLTMHMQIHSGLKPYMCDVCGKMFVFRHFLKKHQLVHSDERPHVCDRCGSSFKHLTALQAHKVLHTGEKPYLCIVCGRSFPLRTRLNFHMKVHTEGTFVCRFCGRLFRSSHGLRCHEQKHTNGQLFPCDKCGKTFNSKYNLQHHLALHPQNCVYICAMCGQEFSGRNRLTNHMLGHTRGRPYACSVCGQTYKMKGKLQRHKLLHTSSLCDEA